MTSWMTQAFGRVVMWMTTMRHAQRGVAALRAVLGLGLSLFLVTNFAGRNYLWGPASQWTDPLNIHMGFGGLFRVFAPERSLGSLTTWYVILFLTAVALMLGWHTRIVTPVVLVLSTSLLSSQPFGWDQGDNVLRLLLLYLAFTDAGGRWSLDSRRRRRRSTTATPVTANEKRARTGRESSSRRRAVADAATVLHNAAVVTIGAQVCIIYLVSGLAKAQGSNWQHGTGVYYPLILDLYRPWPWLADLLVSNGLLVTIVSTGAIYSQVLFPVALLHPVARRLALLAVLGMHAGIAVVMGLPFFSLFMMAGDLVFVSDRTYVHLAAWGQSRAHYLRVRLNRQEPVRT